IDGSEVISDGSPAHPFVDVLIGAQRIETLAMLDTGLSRTSVAPSLLSQIGAQPTGSVELSGNTSTQVFRTFRTELRFKQVPHLGIDIEAATMDHPLGGFDCHALVGVDVLILGSLRLEGP